MAKMISLRVVSIYFDFCRGLIPFSGGVENGIWRKYHSPNKPPKSADGHIFQLVRIAQI